MKPNKKVIQSFALAVSGLAVLASTLDAAPFAFSDGNLILGLRQVDGPAPDLVVNLGPASTFDNVPIGHTITVATLSTSQLNTAFASLNSINWAVFGAAQSTSTGYPQFTLWATAPRANPAMLSSPWIRNGKYTQGGPAAVIAGVGYNAATYGSLNPSGPNNTPTGIIIPFNDPNSYSSLVADPSDSSKSDFNNAFSGNVENTTPFDFTSDEPLSRSDLYELIPGTPAISKLVGFFDLKPDGTLTFTAGAPPTIKSIQRNSSTGVTTVSFTTINSSINYSLLYTNVAGLGSSVTNWIVSPATVTGTGSVQSLSVTNSDDSAIYRVTAH